MGHGLDMRFVPCDNGEIEAVKLSGVELLLFLVIHLNEDVPRDYVH